MAQHGDVTRIDGAKVEPVDIITFGSPCQDLSVAGKRAGMQHMDKGDATTTRSGLFMEAVRIIKEMREATNDGVGARKPRWAVWENVPGAYSSNQGEDFRTVLEELCRIADGSVTIPLPAKGKWSGNGTVMGDGWSVAWRTLDAQHWGVPQRRRRIYLVADFGGNTAPEVLFKRTGLRRNSAESREAREGIAADAEGCAGTAIAWTYRGREGGCNIEYQNDVAYALRTPGGGGSQPLVAIAFHMTQDPISMVNISPCLSQGNPNNGQAVIGIALYENHGQDSRLRGPLDVAPTVSKKYGTGGNNTPLVQMKTQVRKLTPTECERLQGYEDGWTDIPGARDGGKYMALGNSLALPPTEFVLEGIAEASTK